MLSCQQIVELVTEYDEGGLSPEERLAFERHVTICPPCRGYLSQLRKIRRAAGSIEESDLPESVRGELLDAFRNWKSTP